MNVLIFGKGWMGQKFTSHFAAQEDNVVLSPADITNYEQVLLAIEQTKPDFVLNCAGKKGTPNIDWCETHKEETFRSNVLGPLVLKNACEKHGAQLVHLSTGCIYEGDNDGKGWSEEDAPNYFGSFYSRSKAMAEEVLGNDVLQLRLRMPITSVPEPANLITKLVKYRTIINVPNSLSIVDDFINATSQLMRRKCTGIYNVTNPGAVTHAQILDLYKELVDPTFTYSIISTQELDSITKARRSNCVLSTRKIEAEGIKLSPAIDALRVVLSDYARNLNS